LKMDIFKNVQNEKCTNRIFGEITDFGFVSIMQQIPKK